MIERNLSPVLRHAATLYPVVTLTGPRQSGKTTLCQQAFPEKPYTSLEPLETRAFAREDPRGFLAQFPTGAILDEVQQAPDLLSYLQDEVDRTPTPGQFILTGSQHLGLSQAISQSLAGRTAVLHLLPPSLEELRRFPNPPTGLFQTLFAGAYPRIHDRVIPPGRWLSDYVATYVQRDVRQVLNVGDLATFTTFLRLCAGSTAQELNLSRLATDAGITQPTAHSWLSVLETSFLGFRLPPWHTNLRKRWVKAPKFHFFDSGLACHLLGIQSPDQLQTHPLRGALFESWAVAELLKQQYHQGRQPQAFHYREVSGREVDLLLEDGPHLHLVEMKSGQTLDGGWLQSLLSLQQDLGEEGDHKPETTLIYGGDQTQLRQGVHILPWSAVEKMGQD